MLTATALLIPASGVAVGGATMLTPQLGREENRQVAAVIAGGTLGEKLSPERRVYELAGRIASDLDRLDLPPGSVLLDAATGFPIILRSSNPRQFVITPDRDFRAVLSDPVGFKARYALVPAPSGLGEFDAVNRQFPTMYSDGAGIGSLVREYADSANGNHWRVYRLDAR